MPSLPAHTPLPSNDDAPVHLAQLNPNLWITAAELADLIGVTERAAQKALQDSTRGKSWRGSLLAVREITGTRGNGGKTYQVHVDSLPHDVRGLFWAAQEVDIYAPPPVPMADRVLRPSEAIGDKDFVQRLPLARWKLAVIEPLLGLRPQERAKAIAGMVDQEMVQPGGKRISLKRSTLFLWLKQFGDGGLHGLAKIDRSDKGVSLVKVTQAWDAFFATKINKVQHDQVRLEIYRYMRSLWAGGEHGWRMISEKSTSRLYELTHDLGIKSFDHLPKGRINDRTDAGTQYGICYVNRRRVEMEKQAMIVAIRDKDAKGFDDKHLPRIKRDYSQVKPMELVVGDVHPIDIKCFREDGSPVYPRAICWLDVGTNRIWVTLVALAKGEGVTQMLVTQSFASMCRSWGLPNSLYLDNGSEYKSDEMITGFLMLSKLTRSFKLMTLEGELELQEYAKSKIHRSRPYNAAGKPKIEGVFSLLEQGHLRLMPGWVGGERMRQKTHNVGKEPVGFNGSFDDFHAHVETVIEHYHRRGQSGHLKGLSPYEALTAWVEKGWKATAVSEDVLLLAFAEEAQRIANRGTVKFTLKGGKSKTYYHDDLLPFTGREVVVRVGRHDPDRAFIMLGSQVLCVAEAEQVFAPFDPAGAQEQSRRSKAIRRHIAQVKQNVDRLDLVQETARHNEHLAGAPEIPFGDHVNARLIDEMVEQAKALDDARARAAQADKPRALTQFGEDQTDVDVTYLDEMEGA